MILKFLTSRDFSELNAKMSFLLGNDSLTKWCENIGNSYYKDEFITGNEIDLGKVAKDRKIIKIINSAILVPSKLVPSKKGFTLQIKAKLNSSLNSKHKKKLIIAHEIAHTFFFDISGEFPVDNTPFNQGYYRFERLCDYIGRCIIVPEKYLLDFLDNKSFTNPKNQDFNIKIISELKKKLNISREIILQRLIHDLELWNIAYFEFIKVQEETEYKKSNPNTYRWILFKVIIPKSYYKMEAFIPPEDAKKKVSNPKKYPSAKDNLKIFLNNCTSDNKSFTLNKIKDIQADPLDNFLGYHFDKDALVNISYEREITRKKNIKINLCINLNN